MKTSVAQKTTILQKGKAAQSWFVVDAKDLIVGRLATQIARILMGKHKTDYTPHADCGDFVIVLNCDKIQFTGKKSEQKVYRHHTGAIGGLVENSFERVLSLKPEHILRQAVKRMLPKTKTGDKMIKRLHLYVGTEHQHAAQMPKELIVRDLKKCKRAK